MYERTLVNRNYLSLLYKSQKYQLIWFNPEDAAQLESQIAAIHYSGISPYFSTRYQQLVQLRKQSRMFEYDLLASDLLINYVAYAKGAAKHGDAWFFNGKVKLPPGSFDTQDAHDFESAISNLSLAGYVQRYAPANFNYYQQAIQPLLASIEQGEPSLYIQNGLKRKGDSLPNKPALIARLKALGLDVSSINTSNKRYGAALEVLILRFQTQHGLKSDGIIGQKTVDWLNYPLMARLRTVALNGERTRILPGDKESLIVVNIPDFRLSYWVEGQRKFRAKVIVGRQSRPTPLMNIRLYSMTVNPNWNVPRKLINEDILPKAKNDVSYLSRNHFKVLKNGYYGEEVDPASIDWAVANENNFSYQIRQEAGDKNALGLYKFNTPNDQAIYLHDTPSKYLFDNDIRAFSSGCIRVEHADQFAGVLMETQEIDEPEELHQALESSEKMSIALKRSIPVHIVYQTAWYQSGQINYRKDIYGLDNAWDSVWLQARNQIFPDSASKVVIHKARQKLVSQEATPSVGALKVRYRTSNNSVISY
jgi:murein L,D-transpeptidase YcbB/YkuD